MIDSEDLAQAIDGHKMRLAFTSDEDVAMFFKRFAVHFDAFKLACDTVRDDRLPALQRAAEAEGKLVSASLLFNGAFLDGFVIGALAARCESFSGCRN